MYKGLSIEVEFLVGADFSDACYQAKSLAQELNIAYVKFNFNGVNVSVGQNLTLDEDTLKDTLYEQFKKENKYLVLNK